MLNIYWVRKWYDWEFCLPVLALNQTQRKSFMPVTLDFQHAMVRRSNMTSHDVKIYLLFLYTMSTQSRQILCWCGFSILLKFWCLKRDGDGRRYNRRFLKLGFSDEVMPWRVELLLVFTSYEFTGRSSPDFGMRWSFSVWSLRFRSPAFAYEWKSMEISHAGSLTCPAPFQGSVSVVRYLIVTLKSEDTSR